MAGMVGAYGFSKSLVSRYQSVVRLFPWVCGQEASCTISRLQLRLKGLMQPAIPHRSRTCLRAIIAGLDAAGSSVLRLPHLPVSGALQANDAAALFLVQRGAVQVQQQGRSASLQPDGAILIPPGSGYRLVGSGLSASIASVMAHDGELVCNLLATDGTRFEVPVGSTLVADEGSVAALLHALAVWPSADQSGWERAVGTLFYALRYHLTTSRVRWVDGGTTLLARVRRLLLDRYTDPDCTAVTLAQELDCHPDHLSRSFREREGHTLRQALATLRLRQARSLLLAERDETVRAIAQRCGFRNGQRLSEHFRSSFGITPSELRRQAHAQGSMDSTR